MLLKMRTGSSTASPISLHRSLMTLAALGLTAAFVATFTTSVSALQQSSSTRTYVIEGTGEASLTQPRIHVQLQDASGKILEGEGVGLEGFDIVLEEEGATSFPAFLDTGASAYVISGQTADRFGIMTDASSVYHEVGAHGETAMGVSQPYTVALGESAGLLDDRPGAFHIIEKNARLQLNTSAAASQLTQAMGAIDVVGMPAIQNLVVEFDLSELISQGDLSKKLTDGGGAGEGSLEDLLEGIGNNLAIGPAVRLHKRGTRMTGADFVIPLKFRDFNRRKHPHNSGSLPSLAKNPMLTDVASAIGQDTFECEWLLDTGAATSIISTHHAKALGLLDNAGGQLVEPAYYLPIAGISGRAEMTPGYVIERVRVKAEHGRVIEFRNVHAVVKDISTVTDNGDLVTLDGVFGMNLMMPSATGLSQGWPSGIGAAPFQRIWIDGPGTRMGLQLAK